MNIPAVSEMPQRKQGGVKARFTWSRSTSCKNDCEAAAQLHAAAAAKVHADAAARVKAYQPTKQAPQSFGLLARLKRAALKAKQAASGTNNKGR